LARLGNPARSRQHFESAARLDPFGPVSRAARNELPQAQQFFPLRSGLRWTEGDSQTRGKNMFAKVSVESQPGSSLLLRRSLYAGRASGKLVREVLLLYSQAPGLVWEKSLEAKADSQPTLVLRFPYRQGAKWNTQRDGRRVTREILSEGISIEAAGGRFSQCIEVSESEAGGPSRTLFYETFCPGLGRVAVGAGSGLQRSRLTEFLGASDGR
jgi:hypothetical protein